MGNNEQDRQSNIIGSKDTAIEKIINDQELLFRKAPIPYLILDEALTIIKVNDIGLNFFENKNLESILFTSLFSKDQRDSIVEFTQMMLNDTECSIKLSISIGDRSLKIEIQGSLFESNNVRYYRFIIIDQTLLCKKIKEIKYLSYHDQLTGIYNRHYLMSEMPKTNCPENFPVAMLIVDVNNLKLVNDSFGHTVGDQIIKQTSDVLKDNIRKSDILARIGGDEFVVVLPRITENEVENIIEKMKKRSDVEGVKGLQLSLAFGYSIKYSGDESLHSVLKCAEDEMYKNKVLNKTEQRKNVIDSIIKTLYEKHPREEEHSIKVSEYSVMLARALGYNEEELSMIKAASLLHDIGKIAIDYSVLDKKDQRTKEDVKETMKHSAIGYRILSSSGVFANIADLVLSHHEHVDGTGYPRGLKSFELSKSAKILSVCDAYAAMTSDRAYRKGMKKETAIKELVRMKGKQFDPATVDVMIKCLN